MRSDPLISWCCLCAATLLLLAQAPDAEAFCGFYVSGADGELFNDATQVVLMRQGTTTALSMSNHYAGPPEDFAMIVPVPVVLDEDDVHVLPHEIFAKVDRLAAPRLVEYWEQDPCDPYDHHDIMPAPPEQSVMTTSEAEDWEEDLDVTIEAQFEVGEYEIVILSAGDSMGLDTWLRREQYNIPAGAEPVLRPYVATGTYFFVAKVKLDEVQRDEAGRVVLSPLRFHYESETFSLPVRLGLLNANGAQDLIIHVLAQNQRYEVANYPNVTVPTNVEVHDAVRDQFGAFYAALFDATLAKHPRAVVTEYAWDASSCDPCPGPTLDEVDVATLGGDALGVEGPWGLTLTRLHARYTAAELTDDLIFQAAPPILGGREVRSGDHMSPVERGATPSSYNNFQGRYIIRHPWEGEIACEAPIRGRWGGPPGGGGAPSASPAQDVAFAPRGEVELAALTAEDIDELEVLATAPSLSTQGGFVSGGGGVAGERGCGRCATSPVDAPGRGAALISALCLLGLAACRRRG